MFFLLCLSKKMEEEMLNQQELFSFMDKITQINAFNLNEYQDKFYFQKKVQQRFPEFTAMEIYSTINNLLVLSMSYNRKNFIKQLSEKLFAIYKLKENEFISR